MRLSILLPTHNRADVLRFAIESVLAQDFTEFELLVCGDGCTDGTAEVVARYVRDDARVRWFDLPKAPHFGYANRNTVLREARGELIGFMAHDDLAMRGHYAGLVALMEDPAAQLAHCGSVWVSKRGEIVPTVFQLGDSRMRKEFLAGRWGGVPAGCFIHRREALARAGGWNAELDHAGDRNWWGRILKSYGEDSLRLVPDITFFHFRANWRTEDMVAPDCEPVWRQLHASPGRLSDALRWPVPQGMTEQEAFWRRLSTEPGEPARLKDACLLAMAAYARELELRDAAQMGKSSDDVIRELRADRAQMEERLAGSQAKVQRLRGERDRLKLRLAEAKQRPRGWWGQLRDWWRGA